MCYFPIRLKRGKDFFDVPCGKCRVCLQHKKDELNTKLYFEQQSNGNPCYFLTFTLNSFFYDFFRDSYVFSKYVFKKLFANLRKKWDCRYFVTSELGSHTKRLHFHAIIWLPADITTFSDFITKHWKFGFVNVLPANNGAFKYVGKYVIKQSGVYHFQSQRPPLGFEFWLSLSKSNPLEFYKSLCYGKLSTLDGTYRISKGYIETLQRLINAPGRSGILSSRLFEFIDGYCLENRETIKGERLSDLKFRFPLPSPDYLRKFLLGEDFGIISKTIFYKPLTFSQMVKFSSVGFGSIDSETL